MRYDPKTRLALLGDLPPVAAAAAAPTVAAWADRAAALTAFVHRRLPRTLPPVTVMITPVEGRFTS